jgi:penicillin-binding protein 2
MIGVEKRYEELLRGVKGKKNYLVDVHNRINGPYEGGKYDVPAVIGTDIHLTLDADLQEYGERLMHNFSGSVVAIEPSSGEILSLISVPGYMPDLLVGAGLRKNFVSLTTDSLKPLFNRALLATYPPGSTFKLVDALIALQEHVITPSTMFGCSRGFSYKGQFVGCHAHASPLDLRHGIQNSCNSYFMNVFKKILEDNKFSSTSDAYVNWKKYLTACGLGTPLQTDLSEQKKGFVPDVQYFNKYYGVGRWSFLTIRSMGIGQGELGVTPLQMANMTATIANRGYYVTPHILKSVKGQDKINPEFLEKHKIPIDSANFEVVVEGMYLAVNGGPGMTGWRSSASAGASDAGVISTRAPGSGAVAHPKICRGFSCRRAPADDAGRSPS